MFSAPIESPSSVVRALQFAFAPVSPPSPAHTTIWNAAYSLRAAFTDAAAASRAGSCGRTRSRLPAAYTRMAPSAGHARTAASPTTALTAIRAMRYFISHRATGWRLARVVV